MSQPPIEPTPEQQGNPQLPEVPQVPEAAPQPPQFAPPQAPAAPAAPVAPGAPQQPSYAPQPPHFAPPQQPEQPQFAPPQAPQAPQSPTQPQYGPPAPPQPAYGQPAAPQYGQQGAPQYGYPAPPQPAYGQPAAPPYGPPAPPQQAYGQPAYAAAPVYGAQAQFPAAPIGTVPGPGGYFDGAADPDDLTRPLYGATFMQATKRFFKQYANFSGRASRSEYWWIMLLSAIMSIIPLVLYVAGLILMAASTSSFDSYSSGPSGLGLFMFFTGLGLLMVIGLGMLLPSIAVAWRRLHDGNFAGPMYFLSFIPYAGSIILLVFMLLPPKSEGRRFDELNH